jgi:hypothetical protein
MRSKDGTGAEAMKDCPAAGGPEQLQGSSGEETGRSRGPFLLAK